MFFVFIAIFFTLAVVTKSYTAIDQGDIVAKDLIKPILFGLVAVSCLLLRESYFALPDEGGVSTEYLNYRKYLLWVFLALMGYIMRALIFVSVYFYRKKN